MRARCVLTTAVLGCGWLLFSTATLGGQTTGGQTTPEATGYDALAQSLVERAQDEVAQVKALVEQGTLPRTRLLDAQTHLADAQDQLILARTLYSQTRLQDMSTEQAKAMVDAAQRRVEREDKIVQNRRSLVADGILANAELLDFEDELESRKRVLGLATDRAKLLTELKQMAETEQQLEHAALTARGADLAHVMIRYDGSGSFSLKELPAISDQFERKFHRPLPISAIGQTRVHDAMRLDHRNRVDVALNPDGTEGAWLRHLLERLRIPYLAFRSAVAGAATAPHIHIGTGSSRIVLARP